MGGEAQAAGPAGDPEGEALARTLATQTGMTNAWLQQQGLISIRDWGLNSPAYPIPAQSSSSLERSTSMAPWTTAMTSIWSGLMW